MSKVEMIHPSNTRHLFVLRDMWDFMDSEVTKWSSRKDCLRYFYWNLRISNYSIGPFQREGHGLNGRDPSALDPVIACVPGVRFMHEV